MSDEVMTIERPRDPVLARVIHGWFRTEADVRLNPESNLILPPDGKGVWIFANHRSFLDAHVIEQAVWASGGVRNVWACGGPKIHDGHRGAFADSFNIIQVPQPASVTGTRDLKAMARHAHESIRVARSRVSQGDIVIVFPEGTRTRTGKMGEWHKGVARYPQEGDWVIPTVIRGSEVLGGCIGGQEYAEFRDARGYEARMSVTFLAPVEVGKKSEETLRAAEQSVAVSLER